ncbi:MAG: hypothetical protein D6704_12920 [Nitrospirae bacterium]|nr:MAG: hypothetical protein D6704_12920 [Nitrospirota bacterium]
MRYGRSLNLQVHLLIYYGPDAFIHNTPFMDTQTPAFEGIAEFASQVVQAFSQERTLPFEKVYLCNTLSSELKAYEIFPQFLRCR